MIALDIGGTKTVIYSAKNKINRLNKFLNLEKKLINDKTLFISTDSISEKKLFFDFLNTLKSIDEKILISIAGPVEYEKGFRVYSPHLPFLFGKKLNVEFVANDVYSFSYYTAKEFFSNKENKKKSILSLEIGTGVNGVFMNFFDFRNLTFFKKHIEMGHSTLLMDGKKCICGRKGCAERYISGKFLEELGGYEKVFSSKLKNEFYKNISYFLSSLIIILQPDKIVLGGSVSKSINLKELKKHVQSLMPYSMKLITTFEKKIGYMYNVLGLIELYKQWKKVIR